MSPLKLALRDERTTFRPGETIAGAAAWMLAEAPKSAELRLFWFTRGKGTTDVAVVQTVRFEQPQAEDTRPFSFTLPAAPYSFSGKLISLVWAIELIVDPLKQAERFEFILSPTGREILLTPATKADAPA